MSESLISQPFQIPFRSKSQSISEIQHEQLRVSFSILSILQPQENLSGHEKELKSLTTRQEEEFNKEYTPWAKNSQHTKKCATSKVKAVTLQGQKIKRPTQYLGEYFQTTQILTPKMGLVNFNKVAGCHNKSTKKDLSSKRSQSKNHHQVRQKSAKNQEPSTKKISQGINFLKRQQRSPSEYDFRLITSPSGSQRPKTPSKSRFGSKSKSLKEIVIICHEDKLQKAKNPQIQIQNLAFKQNILFGKQNILPKNGLRKSSSKSRNKKIPKGELKEYASQKNLGHVPNDYWSYGLNAVQKQKSRPKRQKLQKNSAFKKLKQNPNPY